MVTSIKARPKGDSQAQLVIKQLQGECIYVNKIMSQYYHVASELISHFDYHFLEYVPRNKNQEVYELAPLASSMLTLDSERPLVENPCLPRID